MKIDKLAMHGHTAPMLRATQKFIAVLMLLVITATVLSPDFAWEATTPDMQRDAETSVLVAFDVHDIQSDHSISEHHDDPHCGCHMFSHLPIQASNIRSPFFPKFPDAFALLAKHIHSSRAPDSLDRPPKSSFA